MEFLEKVDLVKKKIMGVIEKSPVASDPEHAKRTLAWILKLKPDADLPLQIAAFGHDIDRGATGITREKADDYRQASLDHALRSAGFVKEIIAELNFEKEFIDKVYDLVKNHEYGGDEESDILKDADSIAFFEYNVPVYFKDHGKEKTKIKIREMFARASDRVKKIIDSFDYDDSEIKRLIEEAVKEK